MTDLFKEWIATPLPNHRTFRFDGTGFDVPLDEFVPADRELLRVIYCEVQGLVLFWQSMRSAPDFAALEKRITKIGSGPAMDAAHRLGNATRNAGLESDAVKKAAHDIRGGGLVVLLGNAQLLEMMPGDSNLMHHCIDVARDHAKIMRNLLPAIDPEVREADEANKSHSIEHFVSKWQGMSAQGPHGSVAVSVDCQYTGAISARCLETSSIDRIVYNYVNNAIRFTPEPSIELTVYLSEPGLTRWVIRNRIEPDQGEFLQRSSGGDLRKLFLGGITRGGHGIGLANCAEIITDCFGLDSPTEALSKGYLGAKVQGADYYAWFHWPGLDS